ncbi:hypothetical protein [Geminicoccus flavidas]|uniref:hypothetical protein n=1 Tax=Geminicoccus flavidas TaxID=2506407 RepID=UPI00135A7A39|nr:hypothetical protein [Geminicoccus flavidas]
MDLGPDSLRIVLAVLVAAVLLAGLPFLLRRLQGRLPAAGPASGPAIVAQRALDLRHRLLVIRHGEREHLIILGGSLPVVVAGEGFPSPAAPGLATAGSHTGRESAA